MDKQRPVQVTAIDLAPAGPADRSVFQNLGLLYTYDMSRECGGRPGWAVGPDGFVPCMDFGPYFTDEATHPFFIRVDGAIAGFAVVQRPPGEAAWAMEQFFVLAHYQRHGVGVLAANALWRRFPGPWRVEVLPENRRGYAFWSRAIAATTGGRFTETVDRFVEDGVPDARLVFTFVVPS
jgi:predicted acetyltransferase